MNEFITIDIKERTEIESMGSMVLRDAQQIVISDNETYLRASIAHRTIKTYIAKAKEFCRPNISRWYDGWKKALADEKTLINPYEHAEKILNPKLAYYNAEEKRKRAEKEAELQKIAQAKAEEEALNRAAEIEKTDPVAAQSIIENEATAAPVIIPPSVPKIEGQSIRQTWKYNIIAPKKINPEFMVPDEKKIGQVVRSMGKDAERLIGGIEVYTESSIIQRTKTL